MQRIPDGLRLGNGRELEEERVVLVHYPRGDEGSDCGGWDPEERWTDTDDLDGNGC